MPKRLTTEEFIKKAKLVHGDKYDYSQTVFVTTKINVNILCPKHGIFKQSHNKHLSNRGCPKCGFESRANIARSNTEEFIKKAKLVHNEKYKYNKVQYLGRGIKVIIQCVFHDDFVQTPHNHLAGNGCPRCRESKGEKQVQEYLEANEIYFIPQKRFDDCRRLLPLPFDFYLPNKNVCIEYHGIQHYQPRNKFGGKKGFDKTVLNDSIKVNYCRQKGIMLIIIKYLDDVSCLLDTYVLK